MANEDGAPLGGASVVLAYQPDLAASQSVTTTAGADGGYVLQLNAQQPGNVNALVRATASDAYRPSEQFVRVAASAEKNMRLRPVRTITAGQSTTVRFDSDSSICASIGIEGICEWVRVQYPPTFTPWLVVRATGGGSQTLRAVVPIPIFGINFPATPTTVVVGQGSITIPSGDDEYWENYYPRMVDVAVLIPTGTAPQAYEVTVIPQRLP